MKEAATDQVFKLNRHRIEEVPIQKMTDSTLTPNNGTVERERRRRLSVFAARPVKGKSREMKSKGSPLKTKAAGILLY